MSGEPPPLPKPRTGRSRAGVLLQIGLVVALGLLSRRFPLPGILAEHTGDALYAVAAYFATAFVFPAASRPALVCAAFGFSAAVEFSQMLSWPWLRDLRATRPGALLLGQGFQRADLVAYAIGAMLAGLGDRWRPHRDEPAP